MDVSAYLERIGYHGDTAPTLENLRSVHRAHAFTVPFENLDIARGTKIVVDEDANFDKIVTRRRGGFCLELTGLFARALRALGFRVDVIGARVMIDGRLGHPRSHMVLVVHLDEPWIADVGFGGRVIEPLRMADGVEQLVGDRRYNVARDGDHWFVTGTEPGNPTGIYTFTYDPLEFEEFHEVCHWLQTSPDSRFTQGSIASLARENGRVTLVGTRLITTNGEERVERDIAPEDVGAVLLSEFGITLT
jgi:N-hydroxyarylamine O-acetyltransferase